MSSRSADGNVRVRSRWKEEFPKIRKKERDAILMVLFYIEQQSKIILTDIPWIDTGFLRATGYVHGLGKQTFERTWSDGKYKSRRSISGKKTKKGAARHKPGMSMLYEFRRRAPRPQEPSNQYAIVFGYAAAYAIYLEEKEPFLMPAIMRAKDEFGGSTRIVVKEVE